jgi:hypothetical protein
VKGKGLMTSIFKFRNLAPLSELTLLSLLSQTETALPQILATIYILKYEKLFYLNNTDKLFTKTNYSGMLHRIPLGNLVRLCYNQFRNIYPEFAILVATEKPEYFRPEFFLEYTCPRPFRENHREVINTSGCDDLHKSVVETVGCLLDHHLYGERGVSFWQTKWRSLYIQNPISVSTITINILSSAAIDNGQTVSDWIIDPLGFLHSVIATLRNDFVAPLIFEVNYIDIEILRNGTTLYRNSLK